MLDLQIECTRESLFSFIANNFFSYNPVGIIDMTKKIDLRGLKIVWDLVMLYADLWNATQRFFFFFKVLCSVKMAW